MSSTVHLNVIAGHAHFHIIGKCDNAGNVSCSEVELRSVVVEERSMTSALFLLQNVNLTAELGVGVNGTGLAKNLASLDVSSLDTTEKSTDVIACLSVVKDLSEHFDTGNNSLSSRRQ